MNGWMGPVVPGVGQQPVYVVFPGIRWADGDHSAADTRWAEVLIKDPVPGRYFPRIHE